MTASMMTFDMVLGPNRKTFSFNNEELVVTDDQAQRHGLGHSHFFTVRSKDRQSILGAPRKRPKAVHVTAALSFTPSTSPDHNRDDAQLLFQTAVGFMEITANSHTFPPFLEYCYRLLSPLDADTLHFLGMFQDISKKRYLALNRQLFITSKSTFEGASIDLCHQSKIFINILYNLLPLFAVVIHCPKY